jgi:1-deoxy-D-xylulose-5-phosphate synthase
VNWHGVGPFVYPGEAAVAKKTASADWSAAFGAALVDAARVDSRICAITAGMKDGTGLTEFAREFPGRFFDVGIAEGHMAAFAAGLAGGGMRPVVAVYSTFLQRAVDQVMHDVCISNLPVVFCVDRAGVVGADGVTHQGVFDIAMLRCLPNLTICQPKDANDLRALMKEALERNGPTVIRYPRGPVPQSQPEQVSVENPRIALWTTGDWYAKACAVAERIGGCEVVHARYLKPFDSARLERQRAAGMMIVSLENGSVAGGFGEAIGAEDFFFVSAFLPTSVRPFSLYPGFFVFFFFMFREFSFPKVSY